MTKWHMIIFTAAMLGSGAATAQVTNARGLLDDGFSVSNDQFTVKCNSNTAGCVSADREHLAARRLEGYALLVSDVAKRADAWLTELDFPHSDLELLNGRGLIRLEQSAVPGAAGYVQYRDDGVAKLVLPLTNAASVFSARNAAPTQNNVYLELSPETQERLGDLAFDINRSNYGDLSGNTIAHELLHARLDGVNNTRWLEEAMAWAVGDAWNMSRGFYRSADRAMRFDKPFNDDSVDRRGFLYGYAKGNFLRFVGRQLRSRDQVGYLSKFGKMNDPNMDGMDYLYNPAMMTENWIFPRAFPAYIAAWNVRRSHGAASVLPQISFEPRVWYQFENEQDWLYTEIAFPRIRQQASFTDQHDIPTSVAPFAVDPILLNDVTLEFNSTVPEHARLMLARITVEYAPKPDHLRLVFEHRVIEGLEHTYLTLADGKFDAGYVRVVNVPPSPDEASSFGYVLRVAFDPLDIEIPQCLEVGEEAEIKLIDFTEDEAENLKFEASENVEIDGLKITALAPGALTVTAVIEPHKTRQPLGSRSPRPYTWPDRKVTLAPSRIAPVGGCSCNNEDLMAVSNPRMWGALDQIGTALGAEDLPSEAMAALLPSLSGGELPSDHSTGYMSLQAGARTMSGEVCVDPLTTRDDRATTILSLYTPSVPTVTGSFDGFAVAHTGWKGWPANATAALHLEVPVGPQDLEAGRSYPARLAGLQGAGWFPVFSSYDGTFHDFIPWQEAFTGESETVFPQAVAGTVTIAEIEDGVISGHFLVAGTGLHHEIRHWLREGTQDTFEREGTETAVPVRASGRFEVSFTDRSTSLLRAGDFFRTAEAEK